MRLLEQSLLHASVGHIGICQDMVMYTFKFEWYAKAMVFSIKVRYAMLKNCWRMISDAKDLLVECCVLFSLTGYGSEVLLKERKKEKKFKVIKLKKMTLLRRSYSERTKIATTNTWQVFQILKTLQGK